MKGNIAGLLQQAQKMQENLKQAQAELANLEVTGESGGGLVKVTMSGRHEVRRVKIDNTLTGDVEMMEDLIAAAVNDAVNRVATATQEKMSGMASGMNLPPGLNLPF